MLRAEQHKPSWTSWDERQALARRHMPSANDNEQGWRRAFEKDIDLMGRILRDVLKADQAVPGRPGPRPALNPVKVGPQVDAMLGRDPLDRPYSLQAFPDAFALLTRGKSLRQVCRRTGLSYGQVQRLMRGQVDPTGEVMERIAEAFGKSASWFMEYRIGTIVAAIIVKLHQSPEKSVGNYEALFRRERTG